MKIEIDIDELRLKTNHALAKGLVIEAIRQEVDKIKQRHRSALIQEVDEFLGSVVIRMNQEYHNALSKITITTPE
jgi:hypothetical protein